MVPKDNNTLLEAGEWPYQSKGPVEPGSVAIFGSVSGSENQFFGILSAKDTFCLY